MAESNNTKIAVDIVKGISILLNTGAIYDVEHPVFGRVLDDKFDSFVAGLKKAGIIKLIFDGGQVLYENTALEPGADMFEKLSLRMQSKGIRGLRIKPTLSKAEIKGFIKLLKNTSNSASLDDYKKNLAKAKVKSLEIFEPVKGAKISDKLGGGEGKSFSKTQSDKQAFELDAGLDADEIPLQDIFENAQESNTIDAASSARVFKGFVDNVLEQVQDEKVPIDQASETIAGEFENQLNEQVEEYKAKTESRIRRLENIKELVLEELESLDLAAIVVDPNLNVIAMNKSGRELFGAISKLDKASPLAEFISSSQEKQQVNIKGQKKTAHLVISERSQSKEGAMLVCLD